jgi:hypothetical protein
MAIVGPSNGKPPIPGAGSRLFRGGGRPANERRRAPAGLSSCDPALAILSAIVARLGQAREGRPIIKRVDIDDGNRPRVVLAAEGAASSACPAGGQVGRGSHRSAVTQAVEDQALRSFLTRSS